LRQYLNILVDKKLIAELAKEDRRHIAYRTTEKGMRYLAVHLALKSITVFSQEG
jgi:DNA-binding PadR family transcriptional regulator